MKLTSDYLSLAGEYAVASELCRRNLYAQLTLGHQKRTDILIFSEKNNRLLKVEVKTKQGTVWPNCKGVYGDNVMMVLVDFKGKELSDRPDFYVLTLSDWDNYVNSEIENYSKDVIVVDPRTHCPIFVNQAKDGRPYRGMGITPDKVWSHREKWEKFDSALGLISEQLNQDAKPQSKHPA